MFHSHWDVILRFHINPSFRLMLSRRNCEWLWVTIEECEGVSSITVSPRQSPHSPSFRVTKRWKVLLINGFHRDQGFWSDEGLWIGEWDWGFLVLLSVCVGLFVRTLRMDNICCLIKRLLKTFVAGEKLFVETFFPVDTKYIWMSPKYGKSW